jgi:hypothetical protein
MDVKTEGRTSRFTGGNALGRFELLGVPGGEYMISVMTRSYQEYHSLSFRLEEGQALDLGDVGLEPSGALDLEVVDSEGIPMNDYHGTCDGISLTVYYGGSYKTERYHRYVIPRGNVSIKVGAEGYRTEAFSIFVGPEGPVKRTVVLQRE